MFDLINNCNGCNYGSKYVPEEGKEELDYISCFNCKNFNEKIKENEKEIDLYLENS